LFQQDYPTWKEWDLTELTQKWVDGSAANYGVILWANNEDVDSYDLRMYSSEADKFVRPFMEITWSQSLKTVYFIKDHLGSIRATVDENADVVGYDDYDPWGMILDGRSMASAGSGSQGITRNKYQGKEWDDEHGFNAYYFGARYYDPVLGRWCVVDPAGQFASPYVGMGNNPVVLVDPNGEFAFVPILIAAGYGAFIGATVNTIAYDIQAITSGGGNNSGWWKSFASGALAGGIGAGAGAFGSQLVYQLAGVGVMTVDGTVTLAGSVSPWLSVGASTAGGAIGGAAGGFAGGYVSGSRGSGLWNATWRGAALGGFTGFVTSEPVSNWMRGRGFQTDWQYYEQLGKQQTDKLFGEGIFGTDYEPESELFPQGDKGYNCRSFCRDYYKKGGVEQFRTQVFGWESKSPDRWHYAVKLGRSRGVNYFLGKGGTAYSINVLPEYLLNNGPIFQYGIPRYLTWDYFMNNIFDIRLY